MDSFISALGKGSDWRACVINLVEDAGVIPASSNLAFLYVTARLAPDLKNILGYLRSNTKVTHWVGTTGTGICHNREEIYDAPAISALITSFPENSFQILELDDNPKLGFDAQHLDPSKFYFGVMHGNPYREVEFVLDRMTQAIPNSFFVGGLTSAEDYYAQIADGVTEAAMSGLLFEEGTNVITGLSQGCSPIGAVHRVTGCDKNILATLDHSPALDAFKKDIGEQLSNNLEYVSGTIFAALPIEGSDRGDYLVRNILGIDIDSKMIAIGESVELGQPLLFCKRDQSTAEEDLQRMLSQLKKRIKAPVKGALYFSCLGRGRHLFGDKSEELQLIQSALGDIPLVGFFANGEISHNRLYGYTGVLTLFC